MADYDYLFPIVILFLISQYRRRGFISEEKLMKLLDYYYATMRSSLARQLNGQSSARPLNSKIKAQMFEFLFYYMNKRFENSEKEAVAARPHGENDKRKAADRSPVVSGLTSIVISPSIRWNTLRDA